MIELDPIALEAAERAVADVCREHRSNRDDPAAFDRDCAEECVRAYLAAESLEAGIARLSEALRPADVPYQAWLPDDRNAA